jgi:hypothetical protein
VTLAFFGSVKISQEAQTNSPKQCVKDIGRVIQAIVTLSGNIFGSLRALREEAQATRVHEAGFAAFEKRVAALEAALLAQGG